MDNEIIDELRVFTEAQKEKMTTTINALIEKNEEALGQAHRVSIQIPNIHSSSQGKGLI